MKKMYLLFAVVSFPCHWAMAQCNSGPVTISGDVVINHSCVITGDLTIPNGASLNVDFTDARADTFVVRGDILLTGNGRLWIHSAAGSVNDQLIISNSVNNQRTLSMKDSSEVRLEYIELRTQEGDLSGASSIYMNYNAENNSTFFNRKSWLDTRTAWLLGNMKDHSTLMGYEPNEVPTEMYLQDSARAVLHGPNTAIGVWVSFESITDTLDLPSYQTQPFTWKIGRGAGGIATPWYLEIDTAKIGLGVQIFPTARITINGSGLPATGELKVALMFSNNTDSISGLKVGLQNRTVANGHGSVTLNNVNLGPIAWQLYALVNEKLSIEGSTVNEIGIAGPSQVTVENSILQLGALAAVGIDGSTLTISNSEIWNQAITASNHSAIVLTNCNVTGSAFSTTDAMSSITVNGGCFSQNPAGCSQATMVDVTSGVPHCNPFIPPGLPRNLTPATVTFHNVSDNCVTGIEKPDDRTVSIYPNPGHDLTNIDVSDRTRNYSVEVYSTYGLPMLSVINATVVDISNFPVGVYIVRLKQDDRVWVAKLVKP